MIGKLLKLALLCGVLLIVFQCGKALAQTTTDFDVAASADDGYILRTHTSYPPSGDTAQSINLTQSTVSVQKDFGTPNYTTISGVVAWDTSGLPDDAVITSATLELYVTNTSVDNNRALVVDWHQGPPPITVSDFDETGDGSAGSYIVSALTTSAVNSFNLNIADHTIDFQGYTSLRFTISGGQPTGANRVGFEAFDGAGTNEPRLSLTFETPLDQTSPAVGSITAYQSVRESGDFLVVAPYDIDFETLPAQLARDEYIGIFRDGVTYLQTVSPVSTSENNLLGYGNGLVVFYFTANQVNDRGIVWNSSGTYTVNLDAVNGSQTDSETAISYRGGGVADLESDLRGLAQSLESAWGIDIISGQRLTTVGSDYFESAIPFLGEMVPGLVALAQTHITPSENSFNATESDAKADFWNGTTVETGFTTLGSIWGLSSMEVRSVITILIALGVGLTTVLRGAPAWLAVMAGGLIIMFAPLIGMFPVAGAIALAFVCAFIAIGAWWIFRQS